MDSKQIEQFMQETWDEVSKPEYILAGANFIDDCKREIEFWDKVMNPKIADIFPALLRSKK